YGRMDLLIAGAGSSRSSEARIPQGSRGLWPECNVGRRSTGTRAGSLGSSCSCRRRRDRVQRLVEIRAGLLAEVHRLVETDNGATLPEGIVDLVLKPKTRLQVRFARY